VGGGGVGVGGGGGGVLWWGCGVGGGGCGGVGVLWFCRWVGVVALHSGEFPAYRVVMHDSTALPFHRNPGSPTGSAEKRSLKRAVHPRIQHCCKTNQKTRKRSVGVPQKREQGDEQRE